MADRGDGGAWAESDSNTGSIKKIRCDKLLNMEVPNNHNWPRYWRELKLSKQLLKQENGGSLTTEQLWTITNVAKTGKYPIDIGFAVDLTSEKLHDSKIWYVDTWATKCMTSQRSWFANIRIIIPSTWLMNSVNNQQLWVHDVGMIEVVCLVKG